MWLTQAYNCVADAWVDFNACQVGLRLFPPTSFWALGLPDTNDHPQPVVATCQSIRSADTLSTTGISSPSALAVLRLMTNSNLADCWTGRSAGLAPLRTLPV